MRFRILRFHAIIGFGLLCAAAAGCAAVPTASNGSQEVTAVSSTPPSESGPASSATTDGPTASTSERSAEPSEPSASTDQFTVPSTPKPSGPKPSGTVGPITSPPIDSPGPSGKTELTIVFGIGNGPDDSWTLTCDPAGGSHPDPTTACRVLEAAGKSALPPVDPSLRCTMVYGGPERATVTGTWRGTPVHSSLSRTNGCEISRWDALTGLLPPAGA